MKNNTKFISMKSLFKDVVVRDKMITLGNSFELSALLKNVGPRIAASAFPSLVKLTKRLKQAS